MIGLYYVSLELCYHDGKYYINTDITLKLSRLSYRFSREFDFLRIYVGLLLFDFELYVSGLKRIPSKENQNG